MDREHRDTLRRLGIDTPALDQLDRALVAAQAEISEVRRAVDARLAEELARPLGQTQLQSRWIAEALIGPLVDILTPRVADELRRRPPVERISYTVNETAEALGVGRDKVYELLHSGQLPSLNLGTRHLIRADALRAFLERAEAANADDEGRRAS